MKTTIAILCVLGPIAAYGYWVYHTAEVFGLVTKPEPVVSYSHIRDDSPSISRKSRLKFTQVNSFRGNARAKTGAPESKPSFLAQMGRWFFKSVGLGNLLSSPPMARKARKFSSLSPKNALVTRDVPKEQLEIPPFEMVPEDLSSEKQLLQETLDYLTEKSNRNPRDHRPHIEMVEAYARANDYVSARLELMKVLELDPGNEWAKKTLTDIDGYLAADSNAAIPPLVFASPFDLEPELPDINDGIPIPKEELDRTIKLSEDRMLELRQQYGTNGIIREYVPTGAELSRESLASRYESEGNLEQAEEQWLTLLSDYRDNPGIHQNYALFLISQRRWDDAQTLLDRELPRFGQDSRLERIRDWLVSTRDASVEDKEVGLLELRYDLSLLGDIGKELQASPK